MNAITLIRQQHAQIDALLVRALTEPVLSLMLRIGDLFEAHAEIEEKLFYPAFATAVARPVLLEYARDHQDVRRLLSVMTEPKFVTVEAIEAVREAIQTHAIEEEEAHLLPLVAEALTPRELDALGDQMLMMYVQLLEHSPWANVRAESRAV
jgi:hypothetical protein